MRPDHSIIIAVITFRRPKQLAETLQSLASLALPEADVKLLVVDNDSAQSARSVVEAVKMPFPVEYCAEKKRGIPNARNRALEEAAASDYLAFIDDDDTAEPGWLLALYETALTTQADVVQGRVAYRFPEGKSYLENLDVFASPQAKTGVALDSAWTNNVLLATRIYAKTGLRFDTDFAESGGSDNHFFRSARNSGAKIVMCREALVYSAVPPARTKLAWLGRRMARIGATMTMSERKTGGVLHSVTQTGRSLADSSRYCARLTRGVFAGTVPAIHPLLVLCFMAGRMMGLCRVSPHEYKETA